MGDTRFFDAAFTLEVFANTNNVMTRQIGNITFYDVDDDSSRITIGGIGNALFADAERFFCTPSVSTAGFSRSLGAQGDLLDVTAPAFASYDLRSAFGPVSGGTLQQFFDDEPTTRGGLTFSAMRDVTFTAVVPEPSAAVVLMTAVAGGALQRPPVETRVGRAQAAARRVAARLSASPMPLEPDDAQHLRAAEGYVALACGRRPTPSSRKLSDVRHLPEILTVRLDIYQALGKWDLMEVVARRDWSTHSTMADATWWSVSPAFIWPFEMGEGEVIFALTGSNFIYGAVMLFGTDPLPRRPADALP